MQNLLSTGGILSNVARQPACCVQLQFVRWRKPRWIPQAKSKIFKFPNKKRPPPDEFAERKTLKNRYGTQIKALWLHQRGLNYSRLAESLSVETSVKYEQEIDRVIAENERINQEVQAEREKLLAEEWAETEKVIRSAKAQYEREEAEELKLTEQEILEQIERLKSAIKFEDLDEVIQKALETETDYNFAIDKQGNVYQGRYNSSSSSDLPSAALEETPEDQRKEAAA